jgi:hypothetical protein
VIAGAAPGGELRAGPLFQQNDVEVPARADSEGAVVDLAGLLAGERDQIVKRAHGECRIDDQRLRADAKPGDGREIVERVEGKPAVEVRIGDEGRIRRDQQRVTVGRCLGHGFGPDLAGGARLVLHHHLLAQAFREPLRQRARKNVGDAARGKRHDNVNGLARIALCRSDAAPCGHDAQSAKSQVAEDSSCLATRTD